jgi:hypothetical protein
MTAAAADRDDGNGRLAKRAASFLQASLFTSVVAFGVAALAAGLGLVFLLIGIARRRVTAAVRTSEAAAVS